MSLIGRGIFPAKLSSQAQLPRVVFSVVFPADGAGTILIFPPGPLFVLHRSLALCLSLSCPSLPYPPSEQVTLNCPLGQGR